MPAACRLQLLQLRVATLKGVANIAACAVGCFEVTLCAQGEGTEGLWVLSHPLQELQPVYGLARPVQQHPEQLRGGEIVWSSWSSPFVVTYNAVRFLLATASASGSCVAGLHAPFSCSAIA